MPLDPQVQRVLEEMAEASKGMPPMHEMTPEEARKVSKARQARPVTVAEVGQVEDRHIPGPGGLIPVRIYTPEGQGPFGGLVYFHGGGWVLGDLDGYDPLCRALCAGAGVVVVSVDYRLAPEHKFPAAVEDALAATRWVAQHAAELNIRPDKLAVGGDSAGGNLAAVTAIQARDQGGPGLAFQLLIYPVTSLSMDTPSHRENAQGYLLTHEMMVWFGQHYLPDESYTTHPLAAPLLTESLKNLPPALVITAEYDPLRDEGEAYAKRLQEEGVPAQLIRYEGMIHGFMTMLEGVDKARVAVTEAADALKRALA